MSSKTRPIKVHNTGFLLERLAADCVPLQEYRELTQNAIDAIVARGAGGGEIVWDVDWRLVESRGVYKLAIIDTGVGMTGSEMQSYINELSHSGREQGLDGNFGVGAKITAGVRNPFGVAYFSWKEGQGANVELWRDPESGAYGLKQFEWPDGSHAHWRQIPCEALPPQIKDGGTIVVLLGSSADENTAKCPSGAPYPAHWLTRFLNTRYFRFPNGVRVLVRELAKREPTEWPTGPATSMADGAQLREVHGQAHFLARFSEERGTVELGDAVAHWWLLQQGTSLVNQHPFWHTGGHAAALYQHELYEQRNGPAGQRMLQQFGVLFGAKRVVVYVEPRSSGRRLAASTSRSQLLVDGDRLPWERWAEDFRKQMPAEIQRMMNAILEGAEAKNHRDAIRQRLDSVRHLFELPRYRRATDGSDCADCGFGAEAAPTHTDEAGGGPRRGSTGGKGDLFGDVLRIHGQPVRHVRPAVIEPETVWIRASDGTREPGELEDRAARYLPEHHKVLINADFRVFTEMADYWTRRYELVVGASEHVSDVVHEWFEQQLVEAVLGARALRGSAEWTDDDIAMALSEEALTLAVMPRWQVNRQISRVLSRTLGRTTDLAAEAAA